MLRIGLIFLCIMFFFIPLSEASELPITSPYGWRLHPITGEYSFHTGVDLGYDYGDVVSALFDGFVILAGDYTDGYGVQVLIFHETNNTYTRYAHLSEVYVLPGQGVLQGQGIGAVGSSGRATGPHLHLELIVRGANGYEYANPLQLWN